MKKQLPYAVYLDKVYGAWLGKGVGGTLGAPYEGRKQQFEYAFDRRAVQVMLPNDDLDLQVLWLDVLERVGIDFTSDDLADSFLANCPYSPGEYAYFKKNYARGIRPPESGRFNNRYYVNGMGCPIRSEVWACVAPGDPELAAELAGRDGVLDHAGDSVYAEQYLAAVESAAFFESDVVGLLKEYLPLLGADTRIRRLADDALRWSEGESDWRAVRALILRDYGHPDCTNLYQNIGFTILCLVHGRADFIESEMIALNCGFDTDCSCATAGALLGIVSGGAARDVHGELERRVRDAVRRPQRRASGDDAEQRARGRARAVGVEAAVERDHLALDEVGAPVHQAEDREADVLVQVRAVGVAVVAQDKGAHGAPVVLPFGPAQGVLGETPDARVRAEQR
ncbi:MAG TPA: ADP-ribosylglycohydrolase family protein [Armatimonadaceae bacterium]|nr:ADP-ribosylglycohydrolase family protein [Armatimonadaceae bacterium]